MPLKLPRPDPFLLFLLGTVALASLLPCRGEGARIFGWITQGAIVLLFFLHGAKLSREAVLAGAGHWRLHLLVAGTTFVLFPAIGLLLRRVIGPGQLDPQLVSGILFLCLLPSTVQSSIAFTSIAGGNVPAAVCSATLSNLAGIVITPVLVGLFLGVSGAAHGIDLRAVGSIMGQLLLPFVAGHLSRPLTAGWLGRHKTLANRVDRGSILLVVYTAFSAAVVQGLWRELSARDLAMVLALDGLILAVALALTSAAARLLGFSAADQIAIVFCGSKKSLASGVPMAGALFPAAVVGPMIVPLMLFHQMQLMVCSVLAQRYAERRLQTDPSPA
jgi:solute carrier family 10 (sodium/bile acid cotransporter), member 7